MYLSEFIPVPRSHSEQAGRLPPGQARRGCTLSLREPTAEPLGHGQIPPGEVEQPLALPGLGQGPRGERGRSLGVTPERGEITTMQRD